MPRGVVGRRDGEKARRFDRSALDLALKKGKAPNFSCAGRNSYRTGGPSAVPAALAVGDGCRLAACSRFGVVSRMKLLVRLMNAERELHLLIAPFFTPRPASLSPNSPPPIATSQNLSPYQPNFASGAWVRGCDFEIIRRCLCASSFTRAAARIGKSVQALKPSVSPAGRAISCAAAHGAQQQRDANDRGRA